MDNQTKAQRLAENSRPLTVGVTVSLDPGKRWRRGSDYWYLNRGYTKSPLAAGLAPLLLSPDTPIPTALSVCDALILSGGGDLPERLPELSETNADAGSHTTETAESQLRIAWERQLLQAFADAERPVLGVCFGMQLINLHFGGSLFTDLSKRAPSSPAIDHGRDRAPSTHALVVAPQAEFLRDWKPPRRVSSAHRQALNALAPGFKAIAHSEDGIVEAIERGPIVGVEWHPESDDSGPAIYRRFAKLVALCQQRNT